MKTFDAIIIGAGQAGPPLAGRLTAAGMSVAIIERKLVGGTCVNVGCTPTKTMVASARAAHVARHAAAYGVAVGGPVTVDMRRVKARADAVVAESHGGLKAWLTEMSRCTSSRVTPGWSRRAPYASAIRSSARRVSSSTWAPARGSRRCPGWARCRF